MNQVKIGANRLDRALCGVLRCWGNTRPDTKAAGTVGHKVAGLSDMLPGMRAAGQGLDANAPPLPNLVVGVLVPWFR